MDGLHGVEKKEGLFWVFGVMGFEEFDGFLEKNLVDVFEIEVGRDEANSVIPGVGMFGEGGAVEKFCGWVGNAILFDI